MATAAAAASGLRVMTTQRGPARADDDTPPKEPPAHAHRHRAATEPLPRMRIRLGDGVPAQRSAAQPARTAGGERSARRDLLGRWGGRSCGYGGPSPARCCVLLPGHECDSEQSPDPTQDSYVCGVHSVSSLCKMYFRELPNPLLSDRLYEQLSDTVLYHGASPCGCLLLPQSCSHWRRHRHRHEATATLPLCQTAERLKWKKAPQLYRGNATQSVAFHPKEKVQPMR
ncbi:rho GTPase-activating protein 33-like isoform X1 [Gallus gallus]|uniref:rho GTPase-activating protein 33-like isoform X1 n=1 Tax=Gallus gallus TaxID=9031 RepID=UPI001F02064B|nr:rho GTPase-activating protein 33-like isoform X1 [Gallus gallus]